MTDLNLQELKCPRCGGELKKAGDDQYRCASCDRTFISKTVTQYQDVLSALTVQRREDVNRLKRDMWKKAHQEYVFNMELKQVCEKILQLIDHDLYAEFYLATCQSDAADLIDCLSRLDVTEYAEDIPEFLNYLITALRFEWMLPVANLIERAYKGEERVDWLDKYEQKAQLVEDGVFDPQITRNVFVAYSSKDMPQVEKLVQLLEENDLTCFLAARNLQHGSRAGDNYYKYIHTALEHCDVFVLVSSSNSRNAKCDVYKCELPYVEKNIPQMRRVEYLIEEYSPKKLIEENFKRFFKNLDWCESPKKVVYRIFDLLAEAENDSFTAIPVSTVPTPPPAPVQPAVPQPAPATPQKPAQSTPKKPVQPTAKTPISKEPDGAVTPEPKLSREELQQKRYAEAGILHAMSQFKEAAEIYQALAEDGHVEAQRRLGLYYSWGWGVSKDKAKSEYWYQKAAEAKK